MTDSNRENRRPRPKAVEHAADNQSDRPVERFVVPLWVIPVTTGVLIAIVILVVAIRHF